MDQEYQVKVTVLIPMLVVTSISALSILTVRAELLTKKIALVRTKVENKLLLQWPQILKQLTIQMVRTQDPVVMKVPDPDHLVLASCYQAVPKNHRAPGPIGPSGTNAPRLAAVVSGTGTARQLAVTLTNLVVRVSAKR